MGEIKELPIQKLIVWNENPRLGFSDDLQTANEPSVINAIFDVVDINKMLALVKDIIKMGGLNGNVLPTVVENGDAYYVYDGNRRISAIKVLLDPTILFSADYRARVESIKRENPGFCLNRVAVYLATKEEALDLMDRTHSGELGGIGVIPWTAFNYDAAYHRRGAAVRYKKAFALASILGWKKKSDFRIEYTDLERIFSSKHVCQKFHISFPNVAKSKAVNAIAALENYKRDRHFSSFSRQFAQLVDGNGGPSSTIKDFLDWFDAFSRSSDKFTVTVREFSCFSDETTTYDLASICVVDKATGGLIAVPPEELHVSFISPEGKKRSSFLSSLSGIWTVEVFYKGTYASGRINVRTPVPANVRFKHGDRIEIREGETLDVIGEIGFAANRHGEDMSSTCSVLSGENGPIIQEERVFTGENPIGQYTVKLLFDDLGTAYSTVLAISVMSALDKINPPAPSIPCLLVMPHGYAITFNQFIVGLVDEVNRAWEHRLFKVCCAAMRSVVELCCDEMDRLFVGQYANSAQISDLRQRFERCVSFMKVPTNAGIIQNACQMGGFKNTTNIIMSFDSQRVFAFLHVGAHTSSAYLDENAFQEMCQKTLSAFICFVDALISNEVSQP